MELSVQTAFSEDFLVGAEALVIASRPACAAAPAVTVPVCATLRMGRKSCVHVLWLTLCGSLATISRAGLALATISGLCACMCHCGPILHLARAARYGTCRTLVTLRCQLVRFAIADLAVTRSAIAFPPVAPYVMAALNWIGVAPAVRRLGPLPMAGASGVVRSGAAYVTAQSVTHVDL